MIGAVAKDRGRALPLWVVLLIAPVVGVVAMAGLAVVAYIVSGSLTVALTRLDREAIAGSERLYELRLAAVTAQSNLLDLAAYSANSTDADGLRKRSQAVAAALQNVRDRVAAIATASGGSAAQLQATHGADGLQNDIQQWKTFASDAANTLADDSATGMMMISNVQVLYEKITATLETRARQVRVEKDATLAAAMRRMEQTRYGAPAVVVALGLLLGALNLIAARRVSTRIRAIRHAMAGIAEGRLETPIPNGSSHDEIARMTHALHVLRGNEQERARLETDKESQRGIERQRTDGLHRLTEDFKAQAVGVGRGLSSAASALLDTAATMAGAAEDIRQDISSIAQLAHESSDATQLVASSTEALSRSITEIAEQVILSAKTSNQASGEVKHAGEVIHALVDAAERAGSVVGLISDIAGRTNLLALNATIEAARSGEAGRGFSVVAQEVKSLATQTGSAIGTIEQQINRIQEGVSHAVSTLDVIAQTVERSAAIGSVIAAAIEEQRTAIHEIVSSVHRVSGSSQNMIARFGNVREAAEQSTGAAREVSAAAAAVREDTGHITHVIDDFIERTLAA